MNAVKASPFDPADVIARIESLAKSENFRTERYGVSHGYPLVALTKRTPGPRRRIYLSATSHGDEPAGSQALLRLLADKFFDEKANWFICPVLNPAGLARGTRENAEGIDLNRDYHGSPKSIEIAAHLRWLANQPPFDLAICLHEDWETTGFYLYELNSAACPGLGDAMIAAVSQICPIEMADVIEGRAAKSGLIHPESDLALRELWPESIYLRVHHCTLCYTTETPSALPLEIRVAAQYAAVRTAINLAYRDVSIAS